MAATADVPAAPVELIGGGIMEWRRERDRHLHLSAGYLAAHPAPGGPSNAGEVMDIAAALTRQALPCHFRVSVEGGQMM